jgi:transposase
MKKGQQKCVPTPGQQKWHHLFGAYNWRSGEVLWMAAEQKNTTHFIRFLEHLFGTLRTDKPIVLVLDNASYHHSAEAEAAIAHFEDRALFFWLPPYCSDLNPIERFWLHLKGFACANKLFASIQDVLQSVSRCLAQQNDFAHPDRFLFSNTS